jgi:gamma-glutamyltranspeptidase
MVVSGHYLAAHAGFQILEAGGNAIDAGVAAGIALGVLPSDMVNVAGVAPRFASYSFPDSFEPHAYHPGRLNIEGRISQETGTALAALGHKVHWWPQWVWRAGAVCCIVADPITGVLHGGADPRRQSYAVGW